MPRTLGALTLLLAFGAARAQPLVQGPLDRLVLPGDFVTLVFRVGLPPGAGAAEVPLEVEIDPDWRVVRTPDPLTLEPGAEQPVPVTIGVPHDATAGLEALVTLRSGVAQATVRLTVAARRALDLTAPELAVLGGDPLLARVRNLGNVPVEARLELRLDGAPVDETALELPPGADLSVPLVPAAAGFHQILLYGLDEPLRRSVQVIRFGVPAPDPLRLGGTVGVRASRGAGALDGELGLELEGSLSDFTTLELLATTDVEDSYTELVYRDPADGIWEFRLGDLRGSPFELSLPDALGVRLVAPDGDRRSAVSVGWGDGAPSAWLATERVRGPTDAAPRGSDSEDDRKNTIAFAVGLDRDALDGRLRIRYEEGATGVGGSAALRLGPAGGDLDLGLRAEGERTDPDATLRGELDLTRLFGIDPQLALGGRARAPTGNEFYGSLRIDLADDGFGWRLGTIQRLPSELPGRFRQLLQVGWPLSYAELRHDVALANSWQAQSGIGVRFDAADAPPGPGPIDSAELLLRSSWVRTGGSDDGFQGSGELRWRPADGRLGGGVSARLDRTFGPVDLAAEAGWDLDLQEVAFEVGVGANLAPWTLEAGTGLVWPTDGTTPAWRLGLAARWRFDIGVPPALVEAAGGRRLGTLRVLLRSGDGAGPSGVVVRVGRYRLVTNDEGVAEARLDPGLFDARVELGTLPVTYALGVPAERRVEVRLQETTELNFPLVRTASLRGRVLLDSDADGTPDTPLRGAEATLLLRDATGVTRRLSSTSDGSFVARGLFPGAAEVILGERPFGSTPVGPARQRLELRAGESTAIEFLLQPAEARARSFGGDLPRIARTELQVDRAPPGAAPWIEVGLRGDADGAEVVLRSAGEERPLERRDDRWFGRLPVPADAATGVLPFEVEVRAGGETRSRRGQLLVDPAVPLATFTAAGPASPGGGSELSAEVLADAVAVNVRSPFREGGRSPLTEASPGVWTGTLSIPTDTADDVYVVIAEVLLADSRIVELETRLRVLR